ncbi:MAG: bifunctional folylpolyglutamate synthase/dihydrofolate synthase [Muribaculaceae bacterium]|nr:bifunctional folylpolyglutamate synthase/dihydrofolate synthase [Muribaculaceae bacterium]
MKEYDEAIEWLYTQLPMFQRVGAPAYKPGLDTSRMLDDAFGNPHRRYRTIHVAGTNGKGSTAHTIAAVLQSAGYRVGLYTSPHLVDFRERIRVDGIMIPREYVVDFVRRFRGMELGCHPSFFELTMIMAFEYFASCGVDAAVIEVGLGGRLDSTNIITPDLCVITNISFDHTAFLGDTLPAIASEKAGIIKPGIPVVIGEARGDVRRVFVDKAVAEGAPAVFAEDSGAYESAVRSSDAGWIYGGTEFGTISGALGGECQPRNAATVLTALSQLRRLGWNIPDEAVSQGFAGVCRLTGFAGRWMTLSRQPLVICDTGHNVGGWEYISRQLAEFPGRKRMVIGFVNDKDISHILDLMPRDAVYYFTQASIARAMPADDLAAMAGGKGLTGEVFASVAEAYEKALGDVAEGEMVFVGGSTFVVADLLTSLQ